VSVRARTVVESGTAPARADAPAAVVSSLRGDLTAVWAVSASDGPGAAVDAVLTFAATILQEAACSSADEPRGSETTAVVEIVSDLAGVTFEVARRALHRHASRRLALLGHDPAATLEAELRLLVMLAPVSAASVWLPSLGGVELAAASGSLARTRRCHAAAASLLLGEPATASASRARVHAYPLGEQGAVVVRVAGDAYVETLPFLEEFAFAFASIVERDRLARASAGDDRTLQQTYERRLVRVAFDLHDGPLQDLAALAAEVRLLRSQIGQADELRRDILVGRIDDVTSRIVELDQQLRTVMQALETPTLADRSLAEALQREADAFTRRSGTTVDVAVSGSCDQLTASQRIAVVRVVQEALNNSHEHGGATHVEVVVRVTDAGLDLSVADDGCGFDVAETACAAAKRGRLGIVGMNERVRLLGGVFTIESEPARGTTVRAAIPAWRPLA